MISSNPSYALHITTMFQTLLRHVDALTLTTLADQAASGQKQLDSVCQEILLVTLSGMKLHCHCSHLHATATKQIGGFRMLEGMLRALLHSGWGHLMVL